MSENIVPVFSGGIGRSGTTIVSRILRQHPDLFGGSPNEVKFLTETYGLIDLAFGMRNFLPTQSTRGGRLSAKLPINKSKKIRYRFFRKRILSDWWNRTNRLGVDSGIHRSISRGKLIELLDKLEANIAKDAVWAAREFLFDFVRNHRKFQGQKFWMDTTTSNIMYGNYLFKLFPEARFIEMRRHPLDNLSSVLLEPWGPSNLQEALPWFRDRIALQELSRSVIPANQYELIWLEDLVRNNREDSYKKLLKLVGLTEDPSMRKYFNEEVTVERAHLGRWKKAFENVPNVRSDFERVVGSIDDSILEN